MTGSRFATDRVLDAVSVFTGTVNGGRLVAEAVTLAAATLQRQPSGVTTLVGDPVITVHTTPAGVIGWCAVLGVDQVVLRRTPGDIAVATPQTHLEGRLWTVRAVFQRAMSLRDEDDLPGTRLPWRRSEARIGVQRLEVGLYARGMA